MFRKPSHKLLLIISDNLKAFRAANNLSQEELAELCKLHRTYIGAIERCEKNLSLSSLEIIAEALGITVPELLTPREGDDTTISV
ncbi:MULTISPECIES: helix-turn-helix domain-containing protein [Acinetobacter]|jgi:transcriptional regulator with XRE-family HTH domain|uniref:helix-turn-helix domain-containing protein n=3 Tax=Moraxellaceae TaxID=468 RepID=UPI0015D16F12|nr:MULTISPECIES: helix-turn-helix transcriptional regulator [unclassified Acinetobacter]